MVIVIVILQNPPQCAACLDDLDSMFEAMRGLLQVWDGPWAKWEEAFARMATLVCQWLQPRQQTRCVTLSEVRYTHDSICRRFRHGAHRGWDMDAITRQLNNNDLAPTDPSMVLDVVRHHGCYWSLNRKLWMRFAFCA